MKNLLTTLCLTVVVILGSAGTSWSAVFQKGLAAYDKGDYATTLREWTPLAEQEDADAQFHLGLLYFNCGEVVQTCCGTGTFTCPGQSGLDTL